jgi:hypothetical protein
MSDDNDRDAELYHLQHESNPILPIVIEEHRARARAATPDRDQADEPRWDILIYLSERCLNDATNALTRAVARIISIVSSDDGMAVRDAEAWADDILDDVRGRRVWAPPGRV